MGLGNYGPYVPPPPPGGFYPPPAYDYYSHYSSHIPPPPPPPNTYGYPGPVYFLDFFSFFSFNDLYLEAANVMILLRNPKLISYKFFYFYFQLLINIFDNT